MKRQTYCNMKVEYQVPDEVKIESGKVLYAHVALDEQTSSIKVTKAERKGKKTSERNYLFQGKNFSLTFNADQQLARGTMVLRATEDWKSMHDMLIEQIETAYNNLINTIS